ncbi:MAG TPA: winged helix-turn-helix domain-containing protein, partial [Cytophagaceae bacterium]
MPVPFFEDMMNPTIQALKSLGGEGHIKEIEETVAEILELSQEEVQEVHRGNRTKLGYRLAWSRNYLKRFGLLEKVGRAYWALTEEGRKTDSIDKDQVIRKIKMLDGRLANLDDDLDDNLDDDLRKDLDDAIIREQYSPDVEHEETRGTDIIKPFDPKKIDITSKTLILDSIFKRISRDAINLLTDFQRKGDLWDSTK